jgi:hypothetical protein
MSEIILIFALIVFIPLSSQVARETAIPQARDETIIRCNKEPKWCKDQYAFLMLKEKFEREQAKRNP